MSVWKRHVAGKLVFKFQKPLDFLAHSVFGNLYEPPSSWLCDNRPNWSFWFQFRTSLV